MLVRNYTPFVPLALARVDARGRMLGVVVLRGTFVIVPGEGLRPDPDQAPIVQSDVFHGELGRSSLRWESDLAPFKRRSDIHIDAEARAPGGWAIPRWDVIVRVGKLHKRLTACGPRAWVRDEGRYRLTDPEPVSTVPLRYERAFGGVFRGDVYQQNPAGVGYVGEGGMPDEPVVEAPQIESPEDPISDIGRAHEPEGLGPISRAWLPRRALAGTYDEAWKSTRWPELPRDFDARFYNSAHPDLQYPGYLGGGEDVTLEGVDPFGPIGFSLPSYSMGILVRREARAPEPLPLLLDTLHVDVPARRVHLTWRIPFHGGLEGVREIQIRMREGARRG